MEGGKKSNVFTQVGHLSKVGIYHLGHLSVYILGVNKESGARMQGVRNSGI